MKNKWIVSIISIACMLGFAACGDSASSSGTEEEGDVSFAVETTVLEDGPDMLNYGHLNLNIAADSLLASFEYGDVVTVVLDGYETLEAPVVRNYDDVSPGEFLLRVSQGKPYVTLSINYGQIAVAYGIAESAGDSASTSYRLADVQLPIKVKISMKEKGGFLENLEMLKFQNEGKSIGEYPGLSVEEFANFRAVSTTGMGKDVLFRSSSPIDPALGRNAYADSLAKAAGVSVFINLMDTETGAKAYEGFDESYYASQSVVYLSLPAAFTATRFKEGLVEGLRFMIEHEGPYLVHCQMGKDRAGFVSAVLEALMGAKVSEIRADYVKTYTNYYNVVDGKQTDLTGEQQDWFKAVIEKNMQMAYGEVGVDIGDFDKADLVSATERYLEKLGVSKNEIADLKSRLK